MTCCKNIKCKNNVNERINTQLNVQYWLIYIQSYIYIQWYWFIKKAFFFLNLQITDMVYTVSIDAWYISTN